MDTMVTAKNEKTGDFEAVRNGEKAICLRLCSHWANRGSAGGNTACRCLYEAPDAPGQLRTGDVDLIRTEGAVFLAVLACSAADAADIGQA